MECKTKSIFIERNDDSLYKYVSENYTETDLSECKLMSLLGAVLGVTITHPNNKGCTWCINVNRINTEK